MNVQLTDEQRKAVRVKLAADLIAARAMIGDMIAEHEQECHDGDGRCRQFRRVLACELMHAVGVQPDEIISYHVETVEVEIGPDGMREGPPAVAGVGTFRSAGPSSPLRRVLAALMGTLAATSERLTRPDAPDAPDAPLKNDGPPSGGPDRRSRRDIH